MNTKEHKKELLQNIEIFEEVKNENYHQKEFLKVYAVDILFVNVVFKQNDFQLCYFRKCKFLNCDFTGSTFKNCNFQGAQFENCNFKYTQWDKTILEEDFLKSCLPSEENLARDLIRNLRVNYAQIGNYAAVNAAATVEVQLTGEHLYNASYSKQSYYRSKHKKFDRFKMILSHFEWKILDQLWGNGESIFKVLRAAVVVIIIASLYLWYQNHFNSFVEAFLNVFYCFWGLKPWLTISHSMTAILNISRFIFSGLFMAILIKRLSRR